jgi:hypothetical protein
MCAHRNAHLTTQPFTHMHVPTAHGALLALRNVHNMLLSCSACRVLHIHVGLYAVHLERWLSLFKPDQLLIWVSATLLCLLLAAQHASKPGTASCIKFLL